MRTRLLVGIFIIVFLIAGVFVFLKQDAQPALNIEEVSFEEAQGIEEVEGSEGIDGSEDVEPEEIEPEVLPLPKGEVEGVAGDLDSQDPIEADESSIESEINLAVPFTSQAPHADWDLPYQEACEEASAYMVWLYYEGYSSGLVNARVADTALLEFIEYESQTSVGYLDTTAQETAEFMEAFYGLNTYVVQDPTVDQIKEQISKGYPVIVPAAGRELGNPNFSGEGPLYHMLVLRGYTDELWITNDPGTRNGEEYVYNIDVIMNAMGDWNNGDPANGAKVVIFAEPR